MIKDYISRTHSLIINQIVSIMQVILENLFQPCFKKKCTEYTGMHQVQYVQHFSKCNLGWIKKYFFILLLTSGQKNPYAENESTCYLILRLRTKYSLKPLVVTLSEHCLVVIVTAFFYSLFCLSQCNSRKSNIFKWTGKIKISDCW